MECRHILSIIAPRHYVNWRSFPIRLCQLNSTNCGHRRLIELNKQKFGGHIPLTRRQGVCGLVQRKPSWLNTPLRLEQIHA